MAFCDHRVAERARLEEYRRQLNEMKERVESRPLLFERTAQVGEMWYLKLTMKVTRMFSSIPRLILCTAGKCRQSSRETIPRHFATSWS